MRLGKEVTVFLKVTLFETLSRLHAFIMQNPPRAGIHWVLVIPGYHKLCGLLFYMSLTLLEYGMYPSASSHNLFQMIQCGSTVLTALIPLEVDDNSEPLSI